MQQTVGRRRFVGTGMLGVGLLGLGRKSERPVTGGFVDGSQGIGHRLRDGGTFPRVKRVEKAAVAIVGGGMAGLCAAWRLRKRGVDDYIVLDMESEAGGNSRCGENEVSAYPWGAHYVPVPGLKSELVRELMTELGLLKEGVWEERHLCHAPQERLFLHGRWQEGLEPELGAAARDREQLGRFHERMAEFAESGEFRVPSEHGARRRAELDRLSMAAWLSAEGFDAEPLRWLVDYSCRDDYGGSAGSVSAWAGIHYFSSRDGDERGPLTWPEGNGWIVKKLMAMVGDRVRTGTFVHRIERTGRRYRVLAGDTEYRADAVIFAAPTYLARHLMEDAPEWHGAYSPWLTANLTIERPPAEKGFSPAWDNVIYGSKGLGYVDATHQSLRLHRERRVWTYYWALADRPPAEARRMLLERDWAFWKEAILTDLERAHPDIRQCVSRIDVMRLGHAMIRPTVGFLFSEARAKAARGGDRLVFANSDLSGLPLFEEAQYRGAMAADRVAGSISRA